MSERTMITFDNLEILNSYAATNAALAYSVAINSPTESFILFKNTAKITNIISKNNGGSFYLDNENMDVFMNTTIIFSQGKA